MATRSAMTRFLVAAVVFAVILSASAVDNTNARKVTIQLQGVASDYLQISRRNQFCTSFGAVLTASPLANDLQSCVIVSAVNVPTVTNEVVVTAFFSFTAAARDAAAVATALNAALNSASPPTGFAKGPSSGTTPATAPADQTGFPTYFAEVEIVTKNAALAGNTQYAADLKTKMALPAADTVTCTAATAIASNLGAPTPRSKFTCTMASLTKTRAELVALAKEKATAVAGVNDGTTAALQAVWVRDTGVLADTAKYVIVAKTVIGGTTAASLDTNAGSLRTALLTAFGGLVLSTPATDLAVATPTASSGTDAVADITIKVASQRDANRALEVLKQLLGSTIGTAVTFPIKSITSLTITPGLFSDAQTMLPDRTFRYNIVISNTTSAFTSAPYQFRRVCESITAALQGNASACSILEFNRPSGDAGTLSIEVTAVNSTAALSLSRGVVRAVAAIPVSTFALGTVTEVVPFPGQVTGGTVQITLGTPITTVAGVTTAVRNELCTQLSLAGNNQAATITTSGFVPGPNIVNCYITDADVVAGTTANTVVVTARVWWRLADFALADYVAGLKQALTNKAFGATGTTPAATIDYNAAITAIAAGTATAVFGFEADFHITMSSTDFAVTATTQAFAAAIATIVGNNAAVSIVRSVAATGLNPATGTLVTVRVFTASAATQAAAYTALAAQVSGNTTTIGSGSSTFTLNSAGFRRVTFFPAVASSEFPVVPPSAPPATPPARPSTPPATPPPAQPPLPPLVVPVDNTGGDATTPVRSYRIVFRGTYTAAAMDSIVAAIRAKLNADFPGSIISIAVTDVITLGKKFVAQDYSVVMTIVSNNAASAAQLGQRLVNAFNSGAIAGAQVVSVTSVAPTTANPATPAAPTVPAAPPAPVAMTTGNIDITILGTRTSFTQTDQTALTSNVASAINGTASILTTTETSTNARKFTMQASALRVTMAVSAPAAQYPSVDSIINRLLSVRASQGNRLGNSSVVSITSAQAGAAARSGPVALTILVALLVAMLSAMAQF